MKGKKSNYKFLVHCTMHQIREGFEANMKKMPVPVTTEYLDLAREGIVSRLKSGPHLIVVLQYESDADYLLPLKIKLFARDYPVLVIAPAMPDAYFHFLKLLGIEHIIQLPECEEMIREKIIAILRTEDHGKP